MQRRPLFLLHSVLVLIASNACAESGITVFEHIDQGGESRRFNVGENSDGLHYDHPTLNKQISSLRVDGENALVLLFSGERAEGIGLVFNRQGWWNVPGDWNDRVMSIYSHQLPEIPDGNLQAVVELFHALDYQKAKDGILELKMTTYGERARDWVEDKLPGNESWAAWEYLQVDLKKKLIRGKLTVRLQHDAGPHVPTVRATFDATLEDYGVDAWSSGQRPSVVFKKKFGNVGSAEFDLVDALVASGL